MKDSFLSSYLLSPFFDTPETIEIKKYVQEMKKENEFECIKINYIQVRDNDIFKEKLELTNPVGILFNKMGAIISSMKFSNTARYDILSKNIDIFVDVIIRTCKIDGKISIFINLDHSKKSKINYKLYDSEEMVKKSCMHIRTTLYHEIGHYVQQNYLNNSFKSMLYLMEIINRFNVLESLKYHFNNYDDWFMEIDADNYAINRAIEYYQNNPDDTNYDEEYLEDASLKNQYRLLTYNFDHLFSNYNKNRKVLPMGIFNLILSYFRSKDLLWNKVFYGNKKDIKNIDEIISDKDFMLIDKEIVVYVFTSDYFNTNLDYSTISDEAKYVLLNSFIIMKKIVMNNLDKLFDYKQIKKKDILRLEKKLLFCESKVGELTNLLSTNLEITRNERCRS